MLGVPVWELAAIAGQLLAHELLTECDAEPGQKDLRA
jgi:hypothetical protein